MSEDGDSFCRLCAEPTPKTQLISPLEDVGISSKIVTKMQWINIDISSSNLLPSTICFACFDALERTWVFLHNVRTAQVKLNEIFAKKLGEQIDEKLEVDITDAGKPVNSDWDQFQGAKTEIKSESEQYEMDMEPTTIIDMEMLVKAEKTSYDEDHSDGFDSSDSDLPLRMEKTKKKKKKLKNNGSKSPEIQLQSASWDDYMCRCANCDAQCKNIMSLRLHSLQIHSCCCTFKCSDCGKVIPNFKAFVNHVRLHKKSLRYCCEFCNKCFKMSTYLKKHKNKMHSNVYRTMCQNCGATFENPELLQDHLTLFTKHFKKRSMKPEKLDHELKCDMCNKEFKSRSNLHQHKLVHTERTRDFSCHICGKMFFTKGTLSTHMMIHEDSKPFKCGFCPMAFRARGNLQSHISLHSGAKPFVCEQCGKSFRVKRHLKSHSIVHTDLMPYVCDYCNKPFRFKTRLNLHLRQHTGAKPYNCVLCQRDFTNGSNFKKHMKRRHDIDTSKRKYQNVVNVNVEQPPTNETIIP
ncbi:gastrula zinc finger protein XlCGF26.1-like [Manduca sexta]|uniref:gastrula zinc finger protein XlCGF26.1-like n=1 Tax=Manduca sexta TaxID=7130 RepID=UPI001182947E|nr:gastrula zinc finger protein XlCGF26.1-like [Manduca sexta]